MEHRPDIISLLENRVSGSKADRIIAKLGFQFSHRVEAIGYARGICIGWNKSVKVKILQNHPQFIITQVWHNSSSIPILIGFVYRSHNRQKRKDLWHELRATIPAGQTPWMVIGYFNAILSSDEKKGGLSNGKRCPHFGNFVDLSNLHDLGFKGPPFTCYRGHLFERLDHALGNEAWRRKNNRISAICNSLGDWNPEEFAQFRPISLCSVLYKLVMKVIANRFKIIFPKIIAQEQAGFIAGRNITNNIVISQEVLWNGVPTTKFRPIRGIRRGCHLSPYLFALCMEWLGHSIRSALSKGIWKPIRLSCSRLALSHLFFTDDLMIFCRADEQHGRILKEILNDFYELSGHKVNPRKTNIFFSKGVEEIMADRLSNLLSFQKVDDLGRYLRVPLFHKRVTNITPHFVIEKVYKKLQSWDTRQLSFAGRVTLA
ncbi:hypothetical protein PVK06_009066 [Gossypium arboreum]|uniref:Reverse transcriptase domain-containing protein n=1 Tax=Gossypium arboreum TaxID=29729 RepID=A0ABR0QLH6_GOSAR|nr:hypothetical protein PVK06_009066 [Gossypium arboreum]